MIEHFSLVQQALSTLDHDAVQRAIDIIKAAKQRGSMVFICGNGGSAATASHFACDLQKAAGVRAVALTDNVPLITAWANDREYSLAYAKQLDMLLGLDGDCNKHAVVLISCSGKSPNIQEIYTHFDNPVVCLFGQGQTVTGDDTITVNVDSADYGVIEDVHLSICHAITKGVASEGG